MTIASWVLNGELRPQIVHRMPGRMRVRVPALTRVPAEHRRSVEAYLREAHLPNGFLELHANLITGSVVIRHDTTIASEQQVRRWLDGLAEQAQRRLSEIFALPPNQRASAAEQLRRHLERASAAGTPLQPTTLEIADVQPS